MRGKSAIYSTVLGQGLHTTTTRTIIVWIRSISTSTKSRFYFCVKVLFFPPPPLRPHADLENKVVLRKKANKVIASCYNEKLKVTECSDLFVLNFDVIVSIQTGSREGFRKKGFFVVFLHNWRSLLFFFVTLFSRCTQSINQSINQSSHYLQWTFLAMILKFFFKVLKVNVANFFVCCCSSSLFSFFLFLPDFFCEPVAA